MVTAVAPDRYIVGGDAHGGPAVVGHSDGLVTVRPLLLDMSEDGPEYDINFRETPEEYEIGRGEQGVFKMQPYKDELLPLWGVASLDDAEEGAAAIYERFEEYRRAGDFPGMDLARKFLRMGWTRALRYAKYPGGQKYEEDDDGTRVEREPQQWYDEEKYEISQVYREYLDRVKQDDTYRRRREQWQREE